MRHRRDPSFKEYYDALPLELRERADTCFALLKQNPKHPSLHFKCIRQDLWSVRVSRNYRALALQGPDDFYQWFWIGPHSEYDRLIR